MGCLGEGRESGNPRLDRTYKRVGLQKLLGAEAIIESLAPQPVKTHRPIKDRCRRISLVRLDIDAAKTVALSVVQHHVDQRAANTQAAIIGGDIELFDPQGAPGELDRKS